MSRRQIHVLLLLNGLWVVTFAYLDIREDWINRSDLLFAGLLVAALGLHGLWKDAS